MFTQAKMEVLSSTSGCSVTAAPMNSLKYTPFIDTRHIILLFRIFTSVVSSHYEWQVPPSGVDVVKQTDLEP